VISGPGGIVNAGARSSANPIFHIPGMTGFPAET
jgi:hypothetical protein